VPKGIRSNYDKCIKNSKQEIKEILNKIPNEWNISKTIVEQKLNELTNSEWTEAVWLNFLECLKDNLEE